VGEHFAEKYWIMSANVGTGSGRQELVVMRRPILGFSIQRFSKKFDKTGPIQAMDKRI
jgi:hypothetical protein